MTNEKIPDDTYVTLSELPTDLYPWASSGARGWIRKHIEDLDGFVYVWIEWDPDDWRVAEQPDGWYFESHFEPLEEQDMDDDVRKTLASVAKQLADLAAKEPEAPAAPEQGESREADFERRFQSAMEVASESDAFVLCAVTREQVAPGVSGYQPVAVVANKTEEARVALGLHVSRTASAFHEETVVSQIEGSVPS